MNRQENEVIKKLNELVMIGSNLVNLMQKREKDDVFDLALKANKAFLRNIKRKNPDTFSIALKALSKLERRLHELNAVELKKSKVI